MRKLLSLIMGLTFWVLPAGAGKANSRAGINERPCAFRKIYVAEFGSDPRHVNFRLFLEKWLSKKKFALAKSPGDADAVLAGTLSISSGSKNSNLTFKDAELKAADGKSFWRGDFDINTKNSFGWLGRGHIENGAKRVAENIRAACK